MKSLKQGTSRINEEYAHGDGPDDAVQQCLFLFFLFEFEVCKYGNEYKNIVYGKGEFDEVGGEKVHALIGAVMLENE